MVYAPTNQASEEVKEQFYADLDRVMTKTNSLTIVLRDFNASLGDSVPGVAGRGLWSLLVHTGCALQTHGSLVRLYTKQHGTHQTREPSLVLKTVLAKHRLRPSAMNTRVFRGGDLGIDLAW